MTDSIFTDKPAQKFAIIDCESCNLNLGWLENKPWSWSWILLDNNTITDKKEYFVNWSPLNVSLGAAKITGFNHENVKQNGKDPLFVWKELAKIIYNPEYKIVAHNALNFDIFLIKIHADNLKQNFDWSFINRICDSNALIKGIKLGIKPSPDESFLAYQYKLASFRKKGLKSSLGETCRHYQVDYNTDSAHSSLYDCEVLAKCWQKIWRELNL